MRAAPRGGPRGARPRRHRPRDRPVLHRDQAGLGPAARGGRERRGGGDRRFLARGASLRRPRPRHGRIQCLAHAPVRHRRRRMEREHGGRIPGSVGQSPTRRRFERPHLRVQARGVWGCGGADHGHRGRPAGRAVRPGVHRGRDGQEHVWDRLVRPHADRAASRRVRLGNAHDGRVAEVGKAQLRAGGGDLRHRRGPAVAARRSRHHRQRVRGGPARLVRARRRRRVPGARVHRPRGAPLGPVRARNHHRADARFQPGPSRARGGRGDGLPDQGRGRGHGARHGQAADRAPGRRRRGCHGRALPVPG